MAAAARAKIVVNVAYCVGVGSGINTFYTINAVIIVTPMMNPVMFSHLENASD